MDMPPIDLESIFDEHQCGHPTTAWLDIKIIRQGVEACCPTCCLISACIDWAVPALLTYTDISSIQPGSSGTIWIHGEEFYYRCILELFLLDSKQIYYWNLRFTNIPSSVWFYNFRQFRKNGKNTSWCNVLCSNVCSYRGMAPEVRRRTC
jgi:hypothetical protein